MAFVLALSGVDAAAADPPSRAKTEASPAPAPMVVRLTAPDVEAWLDGYIPFALSRGDIAGAVVVVVKDGQILLQKGYGYADVASRRPVDPSQTLFRTGSVGKLFTWTAVMQMVEQGKISLDDDINRYLDFKVPPYQGKPVTIRNLMTHTTGFEEVEKNLFAATAGANVGLEAYLKDHVPVRIYPPGAVPAYSNYGASLAGYIVQRVSGQKFDDYVDDHIFKPLSMSHSTYGQPLPSALQPLMSSAYQVASGPSKPFELVGSAPTGATTLTGEDMAKFMIAHLQDGEYHGRHILEPQTARLMHESALTVLSPVLDKMALGFFQIDRNGHRIIAHGGDTQWFHTHLYLYIDDKVGLFVALNSAGVGGAAYEVLDGLYEEFSDRYFPGPVPNITVDRAMARTHAAAFIGEYEPSRRDKTNFMALQGVFGGQKVTANADGDVTITSFRALSGQPKVFEEIAPFVWREKGGKDLVAAKVVSGRVTMFAGGTLAPAFTYLRTPDWRAASWLRPALLVSIATIALTIFVWPVAALTRHGYGATLVRRGAASVVRRSARVAAAAAAIVMAAWFVTLKHMFEAIALSAAMDPWIIALHLLSIVLFPLAVALAIAGVWTEWRAAGGWTRWFPRTWGVVLAASCLMIFWTGIVYHLLGFSTSY